MASAYLFVMLAVTPSKSREVALIANPEFEAGRVAGHRARRLIDGGNPAFSDPFLVMAEDWVPRDAFSRHPHRGIETVTLVLDGALEHFDSAGITATVYSIPNCRLKLCPRRATLRERRTRRQVCQRSLDKSRASRERRGRWCPGADCAFDRPKPWECHEE
jgi:hypothetical protein